MFFKISSDPTILKAGINGQEPLSASSSSIRFIDEDTRSRILSNLNSLSANTSSNLLICESPAKSAQQSKEEELLLTNQTFKPDYSAGKKLFEKQKQIVNGELEADVTDILLDKTLQEDETNTENANMISENEIKKLREDENLFLQNALRTSEKLKKLSSQVVVKRISQPGLYIIQF